MSLASIIYGNGYPIIVSDRAISERGFMGKVILPSTGQESIGDTPVVDFRVKSIIIKEILCVAFVGLVIEIERMCEIIVNHFHIHEVNKETLGVFLSEMTHTEDISVLFALGGPEFDQNKVMVACSGQWLQDHTKDKLDVFASGSGASEWIRHLLEYHNYVASVGDRLTDCKHRALLACVRYMAKELYTIEQLMDGWGGGFDIIYYHDGQFHRYDEITYVYLYARVENIDSPLIISINHNSYDNGNAIVVNIDRESNYNNCVISGFYHSAEVNSKDVAKTCKSSDVVTCVFLRGDVDEANIVVGLTKDVSESTEPIFLGRSCGDKFEYAFKPAFGKSLSNGLKSFVS